jgi:hypothetical protein
MQIPSTSNVVYYSSHEPGSIRWQFVSEMNDAFLARRGNMINTFLKSGKKVKSVHTRMRLWPKFCKKRKHYWLTQLAKNDLIWV